MNAIRISAGALLWAALASAGTAQVGEGEPAPTFPIKAAVDGRTTSFDAFRGKVLMLDFFATW